MSTQTWSPHYAGSCVDDGTAAARDALNKPERAVEGVPLSLPPYAGKAGLRPTPIAKYELLCYGIPMKWAPGPLLFLRACRIHLDWGSESPSGRGAEGTSPRRITVRGRVRRERMPLLGKSLEPYGSITVHYDSAMTSLRFITTLLQLHHALLRLLLRLRACKPRNSADTSNDIQSKAGPSPRRKGRKRPISAAIFPIGHAAPRGLVQTIPRQAGQRWAESAGPPRGEKPGSRYSARR